MWRTIAIYGAALAGAAILLQVLQYRLFVRTHPDEIYIAILALLFLGLGIWVGARLFRTQPPAPFEVNAAAQTSLGITEREYEVLTLIAGGRSNKEIAQKLNLSPNTVKTHVARLFEKLEAGRRTEAILRARELGLIP
ncbi:response regulator transcription factor [Terricaulis sp.]|uniref:response regulator transcription factor n=1 Tax=Terricaulis sp. TaxID=2768686 RepID=UPI003783CC3B